MTQGRGHAVTGFRHGRHLDGALDGDTERRQMLDEQSLGDVLTDIERPKRRVPVDSC